MWYTNQKLLAIIGVIGLIFGIIPILQSNVNTNLIIFGVACLIIVISLYLYDRLMNNGPKFKQLGITQFYQILDDRGHITKVKFERHLKARHRKIEIGGNGWTASMKNIEHYIQFEGNSDRYPLKTNEIEKSGTQFRWDEIFNPPLNRGDIVRIITEFDIEDEFTKNVCSDNFHAYRPIDKLTFEVRFPVNRPAIRWWVMIDYPDRREDNSIIHESHEHTTNIKWSGEAKTGGIYYIYWEW